MPCLAALGQLGQLAEAGGFEPPVSCPTLVFKTVSTPRAWYNEGRFYALIGSALALALAVRCRTAHASADLCPRDLPHEQTGLRMISETAS